MKNPFHKNSVVWRVFLIILTCILIHILIIISADDSSIEDWFFILLILFFILFLIINFIIEIIDLFRSKSISSLFTSGIGLLSILSFQLTSYLLTLRDQVPVLLKTQIDFDNCKLDFRKDNTYKFTTGNAFGVTYQRGDYILKDSIILLDNNKLDNIDVSKKWVIRKDTKSNSTYLIQLDKNGRVIHENFKFEVISDNRKTNL